MDNYIKLAQAIIKEASQQIAYGRMQKAAIWPFGRLGTHSAPEPEEQAEAMERNKQAFLNWLATQPGRIDLKKSPMGRGFIRGKQLFPDLTLPPDQFPGGPSSSIAGPMQQPAQPVQSGNTATKGNAATGDLTSGQQSLGYQTRKMLENPNWDPHAPKK